ncbi:hypothetical protein EMCRGX_G001969 [Ephydatia muelleri]
MSPRLSRNPNSLRFVRQADGPGSWSSADTLNLFTDASGTHSFWVCFEGAGCSIHLSWRGNEDSAPSNFTSQDMILGVITLKKSSFVVQQLRILLRHSKAEQWGRGDCTIRHRSKPTSVATKFQLHARTTLLARLCRAGHWKVPAYRIPLFALLHFTCHPGEGVEAHPTRCP